MEVEKISSFKWVVAKPWGLATTLFLCPFAGKFFVDIGYYMVYSMNIQYYMAYNIIYKDSMSNERIYKAVFV